MTPANKLYYKKLLVSAAVVLLFTTAGTARGSDGAEACRNISGTKWLPDRPEDLNISAAQHIRCNLQGKSRFSFAVLGDNRGNPGVFKRVLKQAAEHSPDFIVHTGDLTSGGRKEQFADAFNIIRRTGIPMLCALGNHDARRLERFAAMFGPLDFYFDIGPVRFVFINNNGRGLVDAFGDILSEGREDVVYALDSGFDTQQLIRLEKQLQQPDKKCFIVMHRPPPVDPFVFHSFDRNADGFLSLVQRYAPRISGILCGHIHGYGEARIAGVPCIATGGAGAPLHKGRAGIVSKYNYVLFSVTEKGVSHKTYIVD